MSIPASVPLSSSSSTPSPACLTPAPPAWAFYPTEDGCGLILIHWLFVNLPHGKLALWAGPMGWLYGGLALWEAGSMGWTNPTWKVSQKIPQHLPSPTDGSASLLLPSRPAPPRHAPYLVPIELWDWGQPALSSTATVTVSVCRCQPDGSVASCWPEAHLSAAGLSTGALLAIITCVGALLGESGHSGT